VVARLSSIGIAGKDRFQLKKDFFNITQTFLDKIDLLLAVASQTGALTGPSASYSLLAGN
jgi:hypothetical protein